MEKVLPYEDSLLIILPRSTYEKAKDALLNVPPIQQRIVLDLLRKGKDVNYCLTAAPMVYNCFMMNYYITYQELIDIFGR